MKQRKNRKKTLKFFYNTPEKKERKKAYNYSNDSKSSAYNGSDVECMYANQIIDHLIC